MSVIRRSIHLGSFVIPQRPTYQAVVSSATKSRILRIHTRNYTGSPDDTTPPSEKMKQILQNRFPKAKKIEVNDLSGGCGSMYEIYVETVEFKGITLVKQHMLINETLKDQIKSMHGLTVKTKVADAEGS